MKRFHFGIALLALCLTTPSFAKNFGDKYFNIGVYDQRAGGSPTSQAGKIEDASVMAFVYTTGTKTLATLYSDNRRTSLANPITRAQFGTDDGLKFYAAAGTVDIVLAHSDGSSAKHSGVTDKVHRLDIDRSGADKVIVFPMVFNAGGTEVDTGIDLPYGALVYDAWVEVVTTDAGETVDIGTLTGETNADPNGFVTLASTATAGIVPSAVYTVGSNETFLASSIYGVQLATVSVGTDVATDVGSLAKLQHYVTGSNAKSISYTPSGSDTFAGYGYVAYKILR